MKDKKREIALSCALLQLFYVCRPHCKVTDKMFTKFRDNIEEGGIKEDSKLWMQIMCRWIAATSRPKRREELLGPCIDAIEYMLKEEL